MNFDFGKHWDERIVPLLSTRRIKTCVTQAINTFLECIANGQKYDKKHAPAYYMSWGFYVDRASEYENKMIAKLVRAGQFRKKAKGEDEDDYYELYLKDRVKPYTDHFDRTNIAAYQCMGACFYWNTTFGLLLASLVEPTEKWRILKSAWHATVVNEDMTKVFDILYWDAADVSGSRGGAFAIAQATRTDPRALEP